MACWAAICCWPCPYWAPGNGMAGRLVLRLRGNWHLLGGDRPLRHGGKLGVSLQCAEQHLLLHLILVGTHVGLPGREAEGLGRSRYSRHHGWWPGHARRRRRGRHGLDALGLLLGVVPGVEDVGPGPPRVVDELG